MKPAIVLLSGGIDSATTMAIARAEGFEIYAISFDYGQKHRVEIESARSLAAGYKTQKHLVVDLNLRAIGGSALTSDIEVPKDRNELSLTHKESRGKEAITDIPATYVPARNTIFLSFSLAWAETINCGDIFIGANAVDYSGYPDCRPEYIKAYEDMANLATKASVEGRTKFRIQAPLINMTKAEIIKKGVELGVDYKLTWSCYDPQKNRNVSSVMCNEKKKETDCRSHITLHDYVPCLRCDSCLLRAKGFKEAGIDDPLLLM